MSNNVPVEKSRCGKRKFDATAIGLIWYLQFPKFPIIVWLYSSHLTSSEVREYWKWCVIIFKPIQAVLAKADGRYLKTALTRHLSRSQDQQKSGFLFFDIHTLLLHSFNCPVCLSEHREGLVVPFTKIRTSVLTGPLTLLTSSRL